MNNNKTHILTTCRKQAKRLKLQDYDRLSSLPESLLVSILSLLPVEEAAKTSVLSHNWRYLWIQITRLDFYNLSRRFCNNKVLRYLSTVDRIFKRLTSNKIHSLHLEFPNCYGSDTEVNLFKSAVEKWFGRLFALNVEEIKLGSLQLLPKTLLPTCTFICRSLVVLELNGRCRLQLPDDGIINLPNLKKLLLHYILAWDSKTMSKLFKSCPALEVLDLNITYPKNPGQLMEVSCQNLRYLKIREPIMQLFQATGRKCKINAPKLETVDVEGVVLSFRFVKNPCLLAEAKFKWKKNKDAGVVDVVRDKMSALVKGIRSIKSLELTSILLHPLVHHLDKNTLPTYHNLSKLHIHLDDMFVCQNLLRLINFAPNLEILYIEKSDREKGFKWDVPDSIPICLSRKIKNIKVMGLEGSKEDLKLLEYILGNANVLESVLVGVSSQSTTQIGKEARFCKNLFKCPRISKAFVIDFQGLYVRASSTEKHSNAVLKCEIHHLN